MGLLKKRTPMRNSHVMFIAASFAASLAVGACGGKPSEDDCKKFADHFSTLMTKGQEGPAAEITKQVAEGMKSDLFKECVEKGTKAEIDCALKATSMEELEKCGGAKTK
jgi:small lipoprotein (TIGR04454 family)